VRANSQPSVFVFKINYISNFFAEPNFIRSGF